MSVLKPQVGSQLNRGHLLAQGLVGYWLMNEGSGDSIYDVSGNGQSGAFTSGVTWVPGKYGPAVDIGSTAGGISVPAPWTFLDGKTEATIVLWVKSKTSTNQSGGSEAIISKAGAGKDTFRLYWATSENLVWDATGTDSSLTAYPATITDGILDTEWHQIVCVVGNDFNTLIMDGGIASASKARAGAIYPCADDLVIGDELVSLLAWNGLISHVQIYARALSASEIQSIYRDPFQVTWEPRTIILVPAAGGGTDHVRTVNDSLGITDAQAITKAIVVTLSETIGVTDAEATDHAKVLADALGITDDQVKAEGKVLAEALGITDVTTKDEAKVLSDSLGLTDTVARVSVIVRTIADTVGITDSPVAVRVLTRAIADTVGLSDVTTANEGTARTIADTVGITDAVTELIGHGRVLSDTIGISDVMTRLSVMLRSIADNLTMTDGVIHSHVTSSFSGVDQLVLRSTVTTLEELVADCPGEVPIGRTGTVTTLIERESFVD